MKKRLTCLLLCLVMMISVAFTGCAEQGDQEVIENTQEQASQNAITLTMWIVSEEDVSEDIANDIQDEINKLTKTKFKTQLLINFLTKDEYYDTLTSNIAAYEKAKEEAKKEESETSATETSGDETGTSEKETVKQDETYKDEDGLIMIKYPDPKEHQVDIIYIGDLTDGEGNISMTGDVFFNELSEKNWLASLDTELENDSKKIKEYVSPTLLSAVQKDGATYAIPNNNVIGEYKYMLLNKTLMDRYSMNGYFARGEIDGFYNEYIYQYLNLIALCEDNGKVLPIDATYDECLQLLAYYWSIDPEDYSIDSKDFSIFGTLYEDLQNFSRGSTTLEVQSLFDDPDFVKGFLKLNSYRLDETLNYFRTEENAATEYEASAIRFVTGDLTILTEVNGTSYYYDENGTPYYVIPVEYPKATTEDIYSNMLAVCSHTVSVSRSMQIITYMNTNAEFRNLIQYGIEGEHYTRMEDGQIVPLADQKGNYYKMDIYATGNAFIAYPAPGMDANIWESGKVQNRGSLVDPLLGFDLGAFADTTELSKNIEEIVLGDYSVEYATGYSKETLSENAALKAWLEACDQAGKGVYAYKTSAVSGKNLEGVFYIYNNAATATLSVELEETIAKEKNEDDEEIEVVTGLKVYPVYTNPTVGGYTISVLRYSAPKDYICDLTKHVALTAEEEFDSSKAQPVKVTEVAGILDFDFFLTEKYTLTAYTDLSITHFRYNNTLFTLLQNAFNAEENNPANYVFYFKDTTSDETQDFYTYMIYRENMQYNTLLNIVPVYKDDSLLINFDYVGEEIDENRLEGSVLADFRLNYVRVAVPKGVPCDYSVTLNGGEDGKIDPQSGRLAEGALQFHVEMPEDPDFEIRGNLNTEIVKFMNALNDDILELLNSCTNYSDFEKLVAGLSVLLSSSKTPNDNTINAASQHLNLLKNYLNQNTLFKRQYASLFENIRHITNWETLDVVKNLEEPEAWKDGSTYIYYYSPFGVYHLWMETYGYLPVEA